MGELGQKNQLNADDFFKNITDSIQKASNVVPIQYCKLIYESFVPICLNGLTLISANGGLGKSFLVAQMAMRAMRERKWQRRKCLLWLSEDLKSTTKKRLIDIGTNIPAIRWQGVLESIDICDEMPIAIGNNTFSLYKQLFANYDLVFIDPLIAFFDGDENSNSAARKFMNFLNKIAHENSQAIIITHHSTKGNSNEQSRSRGAGAFVDAVRLAYEIDYVDEKSKNTGMRIIKLTKDNLGVSRTIEWSSRSKIIQVIPVKKPRKLSILNNNDEFIEVISRQTPTDKEKWEKAKETNEVKGVELC